MHASRISLLSLSILAGLVLIATSASAEAYRVLLHNGNDFVTAYKPLTAEYDESKWLILTEAGNIISLHKDDVQEIVHDLEVKGFGRIIDTTTIEVGWAANDAPVQSNEPLDPGSMQQMQMQMMQQMLNRPQPSAPVYNSPVFAEPNAGGGIPVSFATSGAVPMSNPGSN